MDYLNELPTYIGMPITLVIIISSLWSIIKTSNIIVKETSTFAKNIKNIAKNFSNLPSFFRDEDLIHILRVLIFGLFLNVFGHMIRTSVPSILYFDTIGTAAVAIALGPISGMLCGAISGLTINLIDTGPYQPYIIAFSHTNVTAGFIWGFLTHHTKWGVPLLEQSEILSNEKFQSSALHSFVIISMISCLFITGSQYYIQINEAKPLLHFPDPDFKIVDISSSLKTGSGLIKWYIFDIIRSYPDKTLSLLVGIISIRIVLPITFRKSNMINRTDNKRSCFLPGLYLILTWICIILIAYFRCDINKLSSKTILNIFDHWFFWTSPIIFCILLTIPHFTKREVDKDLENAIKNLEEYQKKYESSKFINEFTGTIFHGVVLFSFIAFLGYYIPIFFQNDLFQFKIPFILFIKYIAACYIVYFIILILIEARKQNMILEKIFSESEYETITQNATTDNE